MAMLFSRLAVRQTCGPPQRQLLAAAAANVFRISLSRSSSSVPAAMLRPLRAPTYAVRSAASLRPTASVYRPGAGRLFSEQRRYLFASSLSQPQSSNSASAPQTSSSLSSSSSSLSEASGRSGWWPLKSHQGSTSDTAERRGESTIRIMREAMRKEPSEALKAFESFMSNLGHGPGAPPPAVFADGPRPVSLPMYRQLVDEYVKALVLCDRTARLDLYLLSPFAPNGAVSSAGQTAPFAAQYQTPTPQLLHPPPPLAPQYGPTVGGAASVDVPVGRTVRGGGASGNSKKENRLWEAAIGAALQTLGHIVRGGFAIASFTLILATVSIVIERIFKERSFSNNEKFLVKEVVTKLDDVKGCDEVKEELNEVIEYLRNPDKFTRLGAKLPKGVLLSGAPGTGKTMLARAIAGEAGVPFFQASGSEFEEMFVGLGARRVRDLFEQAATKTPCIIFVDEIDALASKRNDKDPAATRQTINELLRQLDGFQQHKGVVVICATNFPDSLDPAILRPGRLDKRLHLPRPNQKGRRVRHAAR
eukprot:Selendium_serpulae@DN385_c0_g1_i1.p1